MADFRYSEASNTRAHNAPSPWWRAPREKIHSAVWDHVSFLDKHQSYKSVDNLRNVRLYGNLPIYGLSPGSFAVSDARRAKRLRYNLVRSVIDTATAHIAKERPRPVAVTDGSSYTKQRAAKQLGKWLLGVLQENRMYDEGPAVFRDGALVRAGAVLVDTEEKRVRMKRIFIDNILWDDAEAVRGNPRQMYYRDWIPRDSVADAYRQHEAEIMRAPEPKPQGAGVASVYKQLADHIEVVESWHLPSGPTASDGLRAVSIANKTLEAEDYPHQRFPIAFFKWSHPVVGLFGESLADQLTGLQVAVNTHLDTIEQSMRLMAVPRVLVPRGAEVKKSHLVNTIGAIIEYSGQQPPTIATAPSISPDLISHLRWLIQSGFELSGITQLSAQGAKPAGLNSGVALREYQDIESERFATVQRGYESFFVELGELAIMRAKELSADGIDVGVSYHHGQEIERISWDDIDLDDDDYDITMWPASLLPKTPAARAQQIEEWEQKGYIDRAEARQLMQIPDVEESTNRATAAFNDIEAMIERFLYLEAEEVDPDADLPGEPGSAEYEGAAATIVYQPPERLQDLELGIERCTAAYLQSKRTGVIQQRLELLIRWIDEARQILDEAQQPPPGQMPAGPPMGPGGQPMGPGSPPPGLPQMPGELGGVALPPAA